MYIVNGSHYEWVDDPPEPVSLEHSLGNNNEYKGLYGEVVDKDIYKVRHVADIVSINDPTYVHEKGHAGINFVPDVVIDLGANIGVFSRYARSLWPNALIVSVEPDPNNIAVFKEHTKDDMIILIEAAIGNGPIYYGNKGANGTMEVYLSEGLGYTNKFLETEWRKVPIKSVMLTDLKKYIKKGDKVVMKMDIEGNETVLFNSPEDVALMKSFDYLAMELHTYAQDGALVNVVRDKTDEVLESFKTTHEIVIEHIFAYITKR